MLDYLTTSKNNGNNVDAEQEMMDSLTNQLSYTLQAQAINYEYNQVNLVLAARKRRLSNGTCSRRST